MIYRFILACVLCVVAFSPSGRAEEQAETLEQLRQRYQQTRDILAKNEKPVLGLKGFHEKLMPWAEANRKSQESAHALISALLNHWVSLPDSAVDTPAVSKEIKTVFKVVAGDALSERYCNEQSFLARAVWPLLAADKLTEEQAALLVDLTEPQLLVRMNDKNARLGQTTEPYGWDVQAAYALALIRSGNGKQARDEIEALLRRHGATS